MSRNIAPYGASFLHSASPECRRDYEGPMWYDITEYVDGNTKDTLSELQRTHDLLQRQNENYRATLKENLSGYRKGLRHRLTTEERDALEELQCKTGGTVRALERIIQRFAAPPPQSKK